MKTGRITYNIGDRGRKYRGQPRNFDAKGLARVVNSDEVQERVKLGDLRGYYGHGARELSLQAGKGLDPPEFIVVEGRQVSLEPALRTTYLKADDAGNIEHEAEFLDNPPGRTAARLFNSKSGGFSSAIDARTINGIDVPVAFAGFDYVLEPNFSTNRGYALDGVFNGIHLDDAALADTAAVRILDSIIRELEADNRRVGEALERLAAENRDLVNLLAKRELAAARSGGGRQVLNLDSVSPFVRSGSALLDLHREFLSMPLGALEVPVDEEAQQAQTTLDRVTQAVKSIVRW